MTRQFVKNLQDGDAVEEVYLLADRQLRANRRPHARNSQSSRGRTRMGESARHIQRSALRHAGAVQGQGVARRDEATVAVGRAASDRLPLDHAHATVC